MGNLMRQYWVPAVRSDELPGADCPPLRVRLLCEDLIAFRSTSGAVGLVRNACPHRGASLFFGRNEEEGLRCVYHGWKFDVTGACVDMPSEPAESNFKNKVRARASPCFERAGVVWTYMGPRETPPPLPDLEPNMLPDGEFAVGNLMRDCNWMQALEGDIDTVHVAFLHGGHRTMDRAEPKTTAWYTARQQAARYKVTDTEYGVSYGAYRDAEEDTYYWRIAHFLFPFYTMTPTGVLGARKQVRAWVPMDDEHVLYFSMTEPASRSDLAGGPATAELPRSTDWYGRFKARARVENDYELDREVQRTMQTYSGLPTVTIQDQAVTESMGTIYDRSHEHLGSSDSMIIRTRRRLIEAARDLQMNGILPPGVDSPELYRQRSGEVMLPRNADWWEATGELRKAFIHHEHLAPMPRATIGG
jgi:phenylpropionate dioxygenase-like ring-hydroxylating dioxygenase large terminal subunit